MSDVLVCTDAHLERKVLIKALKATTDKRRLLDELAALQSIRSKHVVQIYDVVYDSAGEIGAIVEEFLPGADLRGAPRPGSAQEFLKLVYQIAEGIADIHAHNRVHRDIKPINMKFDAEGCLKIFDFGLSRLEDVDASTVGIVGTPGYLAPELFRADPRGRVTFSAAVDVFAFGTTALFLILGRVPPSLRSLPPRLPNADVNFSNAKFELPTDLENLLNACFADNPDDRPAMADIASAAKRHLLFDRHRALLTSGANVYSLDSSQRKVNLSVSGHGSLRLSYDGLQFSVTAVSGDVSINNMPVNVGYVLPGSCVVVLGATALGTRRTFITIDVSHPEVAL